MTNIICYTQDLPGERDWLKTQFPNYKFLETKSSGLWTQLGKSEQPCLLEEPYSDTADPSLAGRRIKTIFTNQDNLAQLFYDQTWTNTSESLINSDIEFADIDPNKEFDSYTMFTFSRCGTMFVESILRQKYHCLMPHYGLDTEPEKVVAQCSDPKLLMCMTYRKNWWRWAVSVAISQDHGCHHYNSAVDWASLSKVVIDKKRLDQLETAVFGIFNFWCNLRICYPQHQFRLYTFEDVIKRNQDKTQHKKIPYDSTELVQDYDQSQKLFEDEYLHRWQIMETNALSHLRKMKIDFTDTV